MSISVSESDEQHPSTNIIFVNFNQDCTSLAVGTTVGYKLFSIGSVDNIELVYDGDVGEDVCIVERLFASSLVALVSLSSPRKLKVCHFKKGTEICNYSYSNTILNVKLNRARLVVCLEESLYIHNIRDMKVLHTIRDTPPNLAGLCALCSNSDSSYLAYPGSSTIGEVQIFDAINLRASTMIPAHDNPLAAVAFNVAGTKLATASEKGTVIRVFSIPDGQRLFEFRRGVKRCVQIGSLAFSPDSLFLCSSSNTETVHVFKLESQREKPVEENQGWTGYFTKALMAPANYLPTQVTDMFNQGRDFATVKLPFCGLKTVCAMTVLQRVPRVLVASADGYLYVYNLDANEGGECTLLKQHRFGVDKESADVQSCVKFETNVVKLEGKGDVVGGPSTPDGPLSSSPRSASYADATKRNSPPSQTPPETQLYREVEAAVPISAKLGNLNLDDDGEFPPVTHKAD